MTKHTIEIEGLPKGWEPIQANVASGLMIDENDKNLVITVFLEIQKTKPREITLIETDEYVLWFQLKNRLF